MSDEVIVPVVVVGGGPTGVTAATLLAQHGVRSLLLERYADVYPLPRAVHVDDEVRRILQQVGVDDVFGPMTRPARGLRLVNHRHEVMAEFLRDAAVGVHGHPQANLFNQPDLERILRDNLANHPAVTLAGGTELVDIREIRGGPAPVRVTCRDTVTGETPVVWTHAVLGCDGANSLTRDLIGARLLDLRFEERWLVVDVRCPVQLDVWDGVQQVCDPRRPATFMQIGPQLYRWEFRMADGEGVAELTEPARLAELLRPWTRQVDAGELTLVRAVDYTFKARVADRWRSGRTFLLGDAAHLTPPFIGQGMGAGLRDAYNLAWKLALVLGEGADERLLDTYEAERRPHAVTLIRMAVLTGWIMTGGQDRAAAVRRTVLAGMCRLPYATKMVMRGISPALKAGPLVLKTRSGQVGRRTLAGTICPQPWVRVDGVRRRLDDVLGTDFAILLDGPPDPALLALGRRIGARVVQLDRSAVSSSATPDGTGPVTHLDAPELRRWLARGRAAAVLLRPDRVVLATAPADEHPVGGRIVAGSPPWTALFPSTRCPAALSADKELA